MAYVKIGIGGPIGAGKTSLVERLTRAMCKDYSICVITNDFYTSEDAEFLKRNSALSAERIVGARLFSRIFMYLPISQNILTVVETGGCPHTAIRKDCSMNLEAVDEMVAKFPDVQIIFIEIGGDNLLANFSPELADATIYIIDVAQGEEIPRKGGPGLTRSDLLIINKTDLAPLVGADLEVMAKDSDKARNSKPFVFTNLKTLTGLDKVVDWIKKSVLLEE